MSITPSAVAAVEKLTTPPRTPALRGLRITFGGVLCTGIIVLIGLAGLNSEANLLYLLTGISIGVLALSAVAPVLMVRAIEVDRVIPEAVVAGRPFRISYVVRNRRRWWKAWSILISESRRNAAERRGRQDANPPLRFPDAFVAMLAPAQERRIDVMSHCPRRGRLVLPGVRVVSRFPFGIFSCQVEFAIPAEVTVYPPLGHFRHDPWRDYRAAGANSNRTLRNKTGQEEFYGVREYRQGDNLRWIHWRRSARTGELVVREMLPLKPTQLIVVLDPWPESDGEPGPAWADRLRADAAADVVISAAATALCDALERGHRAGLVCRAARPIVIPPAAGRAQRQRILNELTQAMPGSTEALDEIVARVRWSSGWHARCLLCSTSLGEPHERVVRFLNGRAEALAILSPQKDDFYLLFESQREPAGGEAA